MSEVYRTCFFCLKVKPRRNFERKGYEVVACGACVRLLQRGNVCYRCDGPTRNGACVVHDSRETLPGELCRDHYGDAENDFVEKYSDMAHIRNNWADTPRQCKLSECQENFLPKRKGAMYCCDQHMRRHNARVKRARQRAKSHDEYEHEMYEPEPDKLMTCEDKDCQNLFVPDTFSRFCAKRCRNRTSYHKNKRKAARSR